MPVHARLLALVAVFALANVGVATYIAAAPQQPARVTIAAASDDPFPAQQPAQSPPQAGESSPAAPPPSTPPGEPAPAGEPTPAPTAPIAARPCEQGLTVTLVSTGRTGEFSPDANANLAQFRVEFPTNGCVPPEPARIKSVTFGFKWSNSDPQFLRRAILRNIRILDARGAVLGTLGQYAPSARDAIVTLRTPLAIPYGGIEVLNLVADLRGVPVTPSSKPVGLASRIIRMNADLPYGSSLGTVRIGYIPDARLTVGLDANSPSGTQVGGAVKELARYWMTVQSTEPLTITRYFVHFEGATAGSVSSFIPANVQYALTRMNGATVSRLESGQQYQLRITGDTTGVPLGSTLRLVLDGITARGVTTGTEFDRGLIGDPVPANALMY